MGGISIASAVFVAFARLDPGRGVDLVEPALDPPDGPESPGSSERRALEDSLELEASPRSPAPLAPSMSTSLSTPPTSKSSSKSKAGKSTSTSKASKSTSKSEAGKSTSKSKAGKSSKNNRIRSPGCEESTTLPWQSEIKRQIRGKSRRRPRGKAKRGPRESESESESESERSGKERCRESSAAPSLSSSAAPSLSSSTAPFLSSSAAPSLSSSPSTRPSRAPSDVEVSLSISPEDPDVIDGGVPSRLYFFDLLAENLPASLGEVRFEWSGLGAVDARTASVTSDGEATTRIELSNAVPGPYTVAAKVFDGPDELATAALDVRIAGTALAINPPGLTGGVVGTPYDFEFVATDVPAGIESVTINWSFGTGDSGVGQASVPVTDGRATASATETYSGEGSFRLTAAVSDGSLVLADNSVTVTIGAVNRRSLVLESCGAFSPSNSGGEGTTVDLWDVSAIPPEADFDIEFDARQIPDRFIVEYPVGNEVLDTGWRGASRFNGDPQYPGGVAGFGSGFVNGMFRRLTASEFQVTIFGPGEGTLWDYAIRCRITGATADLDPVIQTKPWVEEMSQEEIEAAIEEETALAAAIEEETTLAAALKEDKEDNTPALEKEEAAGDVLKARCPWC